MTILRHFPYPEPREAQRDLLTRLEAAWDSHDVFVLQLPTAAGKTAIAETISRWARGGTSVITPTNNLVTQYLREFPKMPTLRKGTEYACTLGRGELSCAERKRIAGGCCRAPNGGRWSPCPYLQDLRGSRSKPRGVYNYYIYMAHKLYRPTLVIDEAHNTLSMLRELGTKKLWRDETGYPDSLRDEEDFLEWADEALADPTWKWKREESRKLVSDVAEDLREVGTTIPRYVLERTREQRGRLGMWEDVIRVEPVSVAEAPPILWPRGKVRKIVLMSATIDSELDVADLGLGTRRVWTYRADSPIPAERRPIVRDYVSPRTLSSRSVPILLPKIAGKLEELAERHAGEKGIVHVTYAMSRRLQAHGLSDRFRFHTAQTARETLAQWLESGGDDILVAAGMSEGLDLVGDLARWQAIAKIPWPSLGSVGMRYMAEMRPDWYVWQALRDTTQACGRVARTPDDYGITYILDAGFERLLLSETCAGWLRDAVCGTQENGRE